MSMICSIQAPIDATAFHDRIYAGEILCFRQLPAMLRLVEATRQFCTEALHPTVPGAVHELTPLTRQVDRLRELRRDYARDRHMKGLWLELFESVGLATARAARDRLILRFQTHHSDEAGRSRDTATAPLAFHRDTWGSNLYAQVNWWAPVYPLSEGRTMAVYPSLFNRCLSNTSSAFNVREVVERNRQSGHQRADADAVIPQLSEVLDPSLAHPVIIEPGDIIALSGAHCHGSIPNRSGVSRISLETRTIWIDDVIAGRGAPNVDGKAPWMAPGWFRRMSDGKRLSDILGTDPLCPYPGTKRNV